MAYLPFRQRWGLEDDRAIRPAGAAPANLAGPNSQAAFNAMNQRPLGSAGQGGAGWVNLQRYLGVAGDAGQKMAGSLAGNVEKAGAPLDAQAQQMQTGTTTATGEQLGQASKVSQDAKQLVDFSGRRAMLAQQNQREGGTGYTAGMGRFDSFLSGAAGGQTLRNAADRFGGLSERFGLANQQAGANALDAAIIAANAPKLPPSPTTATYADPNAGRGPKLEQINAVRRQHGKSPFATWEEYQAYARAKGFDPYM